MMKCCKKDNISHVLNTERVFTVLNNQVPDTKKGIFFLQMRRVAPEIAYYFLIESLQRSYSNIPYFEI